MFVGIPGLAARLVLLARGLKLMKRLALPNNAKMRRVLRAN